MTIFNQLRNMGATVSDLEQLADVSPYMMISIVCIFTKIAISGGVSGTWYISNETYSCLEGETFLGREGEHIFPDLYNIDPRWAILFSI
jgi:hypothetical protein